MPTEYRVLVLSDLHAIIDAAKLRPGASMNYAQGSAPRGLLNLCLSTVKAHHAGGVDLVLIAGDITDHAKSGALERVWSDLHWLADQLGATMVATSGNHDYDSRAQEDPLPNKSLMALEPSFPFGDEDTRNKYFAEHHAVYVDDHVIVVTANSASHHGYVSEGAHEHEHGRYSDQLPTLLGKSLDKIEAIPPIRILLTHHHLNQLPDFDYEEKSASIGQESLLRKLAEYGSWVVLHGHKHRGWLQYASGGGDSPPLISASSFSADFGEGTFAEKVRHQFHVVTFPLDSPLNAAGADEERTLAGLFGAVQTWTHSDVGWEMAGKEEDLPGYSGFGWKTNIEALSRRLGKAVATRLTMRRGELLKFEPRLPYLTFDDVRRLTDWLGKHNPPVLAELSDDGQLAELSLGGEE